MRFLIDAQLPPTLARNRRSVGHDAVHVADVGLVAAGDREIWQYAGDLDAVLVTKDEDFVTMRALSPKGPLVVWIRVGNTRRRVLFDRISSVLPAFSKRCNVVKLSSRFPRPDTCCLPP